MHLLNISTRRILLGVWAALALPVGAAAPDNHVDQVEQGRRIYREGVLPSGAPLSGARFDNSMVAGAQAACVNCHRRSGMGAVEGDIQVAPINSRFLFAPADDKAMATMDPRFGKKMNRRHDPYSDATLADAIRRGVNNSGRAMNVMMPHYALNEADMAALAAYLKQLSPQWSPGVGTDKIRFATVVAPGVEPARRKVFLDMMRGAVTQKNSSTLPGRRHMVSPAEMILRTERAWELEVWELQGAPETWTAQLEAYYRRQPVFAVVSGLSNGTWEPVHDFCEREQVPCWFPSVDLPPATPQAFYPLYFSRGVALEAEVLAKHLLAGKSRPRRLLQVYRDNEVGRGAAQALKHALAGSDVALAERALSDQENVSGEMLAGIQEGDAVMFWLRPTDLAKLDKVAPPRKALPFFSARLSGAEHGPFPAAWKNRARLVYPYELPEKRAANLTYFHAWLKSRNLPLVDEPLQSEVYFALNFLTDTLAEMLHNLYRDYLLERAEDMIGRRESGKAEDEARDRAMLLPTVAMPMKPGMGMPVNMPEQFGKRQGTTVYPRLTLGQGQRFASKGGYIVRFAGGDSDKLVAESDWIIF
ncbi:MAG: c-type cytochrome [Sulfuricella sp.]|nr:c-type cytochrome [Sulfuricella sp.]